MKELRHKDVERIVKEAREKGKTPDLRETRILDLYLSEEDLSGADLFRADLTGVNLTRANLSETNLYQTDFGDANLEGANLRGAELLGTDLSGATLIRANLYAADLFRADLSGANLREVNHRWVNLFGADFSNSSMSLNTFIYVDLGEVKGLDTINHRARSYIDFSTLYASKGNIPKVFLQGCGLSDWEIEAAKLYRPGLTSDEITQIIYKVHRLYVENPIQYYSCFISYSSQDEAFAQHLHTDPQQRGVRCWFAPEDMKIGDKIRSAIDQSIRVHDKLLIILSENSIKSTWVETEVEKALAEERRRSQTVLFPVRLDDTVMDTEEAWAAEIHDTRHIGDFSRWKDHDAYQRAFERLLRDLKAEG